PEMAESPRLITQGDPDPGPSASAGRAATTGRAARVAAAAPAASARRVVDPRPFTGVSFDRRGRDVPDCARNLHLLARVGLRARLVGKGGAAGPAGRSGPRSGIRAPAQTRSAGPGFPLGLSRCARGYSRVSIGLVQCPTRCTTTAAHP